MVAEFHLVHSIFNDEFTRREAVGVERLVKLFLLNLLFRKMSTHFADKRLLGH